MVIKNTKLGGENINSEKSATATIEKQTRGDYSFRKPVKDDGADVWTLIKNSMLLDLSPYSYLMWC